jgi:uncharacterized membrane protein
MEPPEILSGATKPAPGLQVQGFFDRLRRDYVLLTLVGLTLMVNLALFGFLLVRYNGLPDPLPLHFDVSGLPDRIESKNGILALPAIGLVVFGLNSAFGILAYRRQRAATLLLVVGALCVQMLMWFATINIAGGLF